MSKKLPLLSKQKPISLSEYMKKVSGHAAKITIGTNSIGIVNTSAFSHQGNVGEDESNREPKKPN